jgi:hypothetical protein
VRADSETTVIVDGEDAARYLGVRLRAGPVATSARLDTGAERHQLTFAPGQRHELAIPPTSAGAWKITIRTGAGFRPSDLDPAAKDDRPLGVWIEIF